MAAIVSIDPGIRGCGVAAFSTAPGTLLIRAAYVPNPLKRGGTLREISSMGGAVREYVRDLEIETLAVERPLKVWGSTFQHLLPLLAISANALARLTPEPATIEYFPAQWKGTGDADACTRRVRRALSASEFSRIEKGEKWCGECAKHEGGACTKPSCLAHNCYDGIGIGLMALGRFYPTIKVRR